MNTNFKLITDIKLISVVRLIAILSLSLLTVNSFAKDFGAAVNDLNVKSYSKKVKAVQALQNIENPRTLEVLKAFKNGQLYQLRATSDLVIATERDDGLNIVRAVDGEELGNKSSGALKKVKINNRVRAAARNAISSIELSASSAADRLKAARNLIKQPDEKLRSILLTAISKERVVKVKHNLEVALSLIDIHATDKSTRLDAINKLGSTVEPRAIALLNALLEKDERGHYIETDKDITDAAERGLEKANSKASLFEVLKNLFFGLSFGSILLLAAIGLAITFGVMGVINMAHGEMIMIGAYTTYAVQRMFPQWIEMSVIIAIPLAFLVAGCVGILIERLVIRHLYGRPLETLLATFGVSLFLQQLARSYNSNNVPVESPSWLSGSWQINGVLDFNFVHIYIIIFSLIVLSVLALVLKKTHMGLQMRAVTQNRAMANSMGIRSSWVDALTFGLGSGIAGMAGVALSQITNVGPNLGQGYIIESFMVVVFGGVGNLLGTLFGAFSLGIFSKFLEPEVGPVISKIVMLIFIILFIQWRPRGLFALKGRFVED